MDNHLIVEISFYANRFRFFLLGIPLVFLLTATEQLNITMSIYSNGSAFLIIVDSLLPKLCGPLVRSVFSIALKVKHKAYGCCLLADSFVPVGH